MPRYAYKDNDDNVIYRTYPMSKIPKSFTLGGKKFKRDVRTEFREASGGNFKSTPGNWPMASDAAGVHPDQIAEATAMSIKKGVPASFTPDGRVIFTSRKHRQDYCRTIGMHDRNGGYSDP